MSDFMSEVWAWKRRHPDAMGMPIADLIEALAKLPADACLLAADLELVRLGYVDLERAGRSIGPSLADHDIILRIGPMPPEGER